MCSADGSELCCGMNFVIDPREVERRGLTAATGANFNWFLTRCLVPGGSGWMDDMKQTFMNDVSHPFDISNLSCSNANGDGSSFTESSWFVQDYSSWAFWLEFSTNFGYWGAYEMSMSSEYSLWYYSQYSQASSSSSSSSSSTASGGASSAGSMDWTSFVVYDGEYSMGTQNADGSYLQADGFYYFLTYDTAGNAIWTVNTEYWYTTTTTTTTTTTYDDTSAGASSTVTGAAVCQDTPVAMPAGCEAAGTCPWCSYYATNPTTCGLYEAWLAQSNCCACGGGMYVTTTTTYVEWDWSSYPGMYVVAEQIAEGQVKGELYSDLAQA